MPRAWRRHRPRHEVDPGPTSAFCVPAGAADLLGVNCPGQSHQYGPHCWRSPRALLGHRPARRGRGAEGAPEAFTSDPDRLARFEREAKVLASLNHPSIGGIHGLEESDGVKALVLEL